LTGFYFFQLSGTVQNDWKSSQHIYPIRLAVEFGTFIFFGEPDMSFSEKIKLEVNKRAAFRCCMCQRISVRIHCIIPEENGGTDFIDNAAPLCAACYAELGDNPRKCENIKEMRDEWYEKVKAVFAANPVFKQVNDNQLKTLSGCLDKKH